MSRRGIEAAASLRVLSIVQEGSCWSRASTTTSANAGCGMEHQSAFLLWFPPRRAAIRTEPGGGRNSAQSAVSASVRGGSNNGTRQPLAASASLEPRRRTRTRGRFGSNRRPCNPPRQSTGWPAVGRRGILHSACGVGWPRRRRRRRRRPNVSSVFCQCAIAECWYIADGLLLMLDSAALSDRHRGRRRPTDPPTGTRQVRHGGAIIELAPILSAVPSFAESGPSPASATAPRERAEPLDRITRSAPGTRRRAASMRRLADVPS
jgi:hypothetical protein